jgi:hypothetical protein
MKEIVANAFTLARKSFGPNGLPALTKIEASLL